MAEREQVKPFASATLGGVRSSSSSDDDEALSMEMQLRKRRYIQCCGCIAALFLILAVVVLVLSFTVFRIGDPLIRLNSLTIQSLDISTNGSLKTRVNLTLLVDVSVKNPNAATFKFDNCSTTIYYGGRVVGEGVHFQEKIKPRRTLRRNVTVAIDPVKFVEVPGFITDLRVAKRLNVSSHTIISGRVNVMNLVKKHVVVKFNCFMNVRFPNNGFHGEKCKPELDF
ncbi:hypothetical protein ES319_A12G243500v1 [Gossypium barbadense]|uniref:Late embryogenesis abundant protein LEA-2 subgroup domain-containing protein n=1 Tax=Gossypium barbadense TaxID=3634 RepID=A0A5J5TEH5_GOSBA|nr:hypothetical protein ES319_A12G243500v1 [Gossypium barbadense]